MTVTIELDDKTAERLKSIAEKRGMSIGLYLRQLAEDVAPPSSERLTNEEFERLLDEASRGLDHLQPLPADFSRADIYSDHD